MITKIIGNTEKKMAVDQNDINGLSSDYVMQRYSNSSEAKHVLVNKGVYGNATSTYMFARFNLSNGDWNLNAVGRLFIRGYWKTEVDDNSSPIELFISVNPDRSIRIAKAIITDPSSNMKSNPIKVLRFVVNETEYLIIYAYSHYYGLFYFDRIMLFPDAGINLDCRRSKIYFSTSDGASGTDVVQRYLYSATS